jgi:hypothetical protein
MAAPLPPPKMIRIVAAAPACHLLFLLWELKIIYELAKDRG